MPEELILKTYITETKAVEGERAFNVTFTTDTPDRDGDVVVAKGAKLANFRKNPVVLPAHKYSEPAIARAENLVKTDHGITAKVIFPTEGTYPLADTYYGLYEQKIMRAWSVGFMPIKSEDIVDDNDVDGKAVRRGRRFKTWEMLEFSACSVPTNPDALNNMLSKGIDVEPLKEAGFIEIEEKEDVADKKTREMLLDLATENEEEEKAKYKCECIKCDYKMTSDKHCKEIKCPKCGGTMRRVERPGPGEAGKLADSDKSNKIADEIKENALDTPTFIEMKLEKDEKEEYSIDDLIKKICEINIENKELKEKMKEVELKAGAVLNAKNKKDLKDAQALIQSVLDSATTGEEDSLEIEDEKDIEDDNIVIDLTTDTVDNPPIDEKGDEDKIEVDEKVIADCITKQMNYTLGKLDKSDT